MSIALSPTIRGLDQSRLTITGVSRTISTSFQEQVLALGEIGQLRYRPVPEMVLHRDLHPHRTGVPSKMGERAGHNKLQALLFRKAWVRLAGRAPNGGRLKRRRMLDGALGGGYLAPPNVSVRMRQIGRGRDHGDPQPEARQDLAHLVHAASPAAGQKRLVYLDGGQAESGGLLQPLLHRHGLVDEDGRKQTDRYPGKGGAVLTHCCIVLPCRRRPLVPSGRRGYRTGLPRLLSNAR